VKSVAFHPKGVMVASGSKDGTIRLWNVDSGKMVRIIQNAGGEILSVDISPDGATLAAGGMFQGPKLWNISTGMPINNLPFEKDLRGGGKVAFSPDGSVLAWSTGGGVDFCNLSTGRIGQLDHVGAFPIAFSPKGRFLASGGKHGSVKVWNTATGMPTASMVGHDGVQRLMAVVFSPNGSLLATAGYDPSVKVWDVRTAELQGTIPHELRVHSLAYNPAGTILASGGAESDFGVILRNTANGEILTTLAGHDGVILDIAFSPDGKLVVSGSVDKALCIWELTTEK